MTSRGLLIKGYKINLEKYCKHHNWEEIPDDIESFSNLVDDKNILFVRRAYDSIDLDDYGLYHTIEIYDLGMSGKVDVSKLQSFSEEKEDIFQDQDKPYYEDYGVFIDYYDMDRDYNYGSCH